MSQTPRRKNLMEGADIVVKHEPQWGAVLDRISHAEERIIGTESRLGALESQLSGVGGKLDDLKLIVKGDYVGGVWQTGIRDTIDAQSRDIMATKVLAQSANDKADKFLVRVNWAIGGLWVIVTLALADLINSYFGLWGAAHAARSLGGG